MASAMCQIGTNKKTGGIEQQYSAYIRQWLGVSKNNTAIYRGNVQLSLPITSITEKYKVGKCQTVMMLRFCNDIQICDNSLRDEHIERANEKQQSL